VWLAGILDDHVFPMGQDFKLRILKPLKRPLWRQTTFFVF